ncbi:MAG: glutathione S-transferase family protein [Pseudomonadota bacterium]
MLALSHFRLCPKSRAIRIALAELGLSPQLTEESPWTPRPQLLSLNPAGDLPVLRMADGSLLIGSYAISEFLDEARNDHALWGRLIGAEDAEASLALSISFFPGATAEDRAEVRRLVAWFHEKCDREVTRELLLEKVRPAFERHASESPNAEYLRTAQANLRYHLDYIGFLAHQRRWLAGDAMSFADISAAAHMSVADYVGEVPWDQYPHARDWYQRIKSRKSMRSLFTERIAGLNPPAHYESLDF